MFKALGDRISNSRLANLLRSWAQRTVLPGFQGLDLLFVTRFFFKGIMNGALALRASAISFQLIMAFFPTIILVFSLIPYISVDLQDMLLDYLSRLIPNQAYAMFEGTIVDLIKHKRTGILSVTFVLVLYYSSRSVSSILMAFNHSVNLINRNKAIKQFFVSLALMLGLTVMVITAMALITASDWSAAKLQELDFLDSGIQSFFFYVLNYGIIFLLFVTSISLLYNIGDSNQKAWRIFSAGSIFASLLMVLVSLGFATYVNKFTSFDELYGYVGSAIGAVIILCLWLYFNSLILLVGFELNTSISRATRHQAASLLDSLVEDSPKL